MFELALVGILIPFPDSKQDWIFAFPSVGLVHEFKGCKGSAEGELARRMSKCAI